MLVFAFLIGKKLIQFHFSSVIDGFLLSSNVMLIEKAYKERLRRERLKHSVSPVGSEVPRAVCSPTKQTWWVMGWQLSGTGLLTFAKKIKK